LDGGGVYKGTLRRCTLTQNKAYRGGGCFASTVSHSSISDNVAENNGGGAFNGRLDNCVLFGNSADYAGGSYYGTLNNCTLYGNSAVNSGGGLQRGTLSNCIVYGNTAGSEGNNWTASDVTAFSHCCTTPRPDGVGNIDGDPNFVDAANENFRLQDLSPCIDAGDSSLVSADTDIYGRQRILDASVEMGASEFIGVPVIEITTQGTTVLPTVTSYTLEGVNSKWVVGTMAWENSANGASGEIVVSGLEWEVSSIPLAAGANTITVSGSNIYGDVDSDSVRIVQADLRAPDLGNRSKVKANDEPVDALPDSQMCVFPDGDSFRALLLYKALNSDGFVNIQARPFSLRNGRVESDALSRLMSAEYPEHFLLRPRLAALDDFHVFISWADVIRDGDLEEYVFKGLIYNMKTGKVGETVDLNERFVAQTFSTYSIIRVGRADDNKVFLMYNYKIQQGSLDNYRIQGHLISYEGTAITSVSERGDLYTGNKYFESMGARIHSFANDDRFMVIYKQENMEELKELRGMVFQLDESEPLGWKCVNRDQFFYATQSSFSGSNIWLSGPHGNSVEDGSKFMASWEVHYGYEDYVVMAHITDDHQLVADSGFRFDSSVSRIDFARHSFVENQEYAWVNWTVNNDDVDVNYKLMDCRVNPPVPIYEILKVDQAEKDRYWFNTLNSLPNGDILIAADGDTVDGTNWIKLFYIPVPSVALRVSDSEGGETGDTRLAFTATQDAAEPSYVDVEYAISGTVSNGVDIKPLDGDVTLDGYSSTTAIPIDVLSDEESEGDETLTLQLLPGPGYKIGSSSKATVTVSDRPMHDYLFHLVSDPALSAPDADADGDGVINLVEYFMGTSPTNGADHAALVNKWDGSFKIQYPRSKSQDDLTATYFWCRDLNAKVWYRNGQSDGEIQVFMTETIISDPTADPEIVEVLVESASDPQPESIFVRMKLQ